MVDRQIVRRDIAIELRDEVIANSPFTRETYNTEGTLAAFGDLPPTVTEALIPTGSCRTASLIALQKAASTSYPSPDAA